MKLLRRLVLVLVFTASAFAATPPADREKITAEVLRADEQRIAALLANDVKALDRLYADELVYIHSAGKIDGKKAYLASLAAGNLTYVSLRYDPAPRVTVAGPDTAIVTGKTFIEAKNKAGPMKRVLTTVTVYVRRGATWQAISYQGTPTQP